MTALFDIASYRVIATGNGSEVCQIEATVRVEVNGRLLAASASGGTPQSALGTAMFRVLSQFFRNLNPINVSMEPDFRSALRILLEGFKQQILDRQTKN